MPRTAVFVQQAISNKLYKQTCGQTDS